MEEIARQRAMVADLVVHISEAKAVDLHHLADIAQVAKAAVKRGGDHAVPVTLQVKNDLPRAGRVPRAFAVNSI